MGQRINVRGRVHDNIGFVLLSHAIVTIRLVSRRCKVRERGSKLVSLRSFPPIKTAEEMIKSIVKARRKEQRVSRVTPTQQ